MRIKPNVRVLNDNNTAYMLTKKVHNNDINHRVTISIRNVQFFDLVAPLHTFESIQNLFPVGGLILKRFPSRVYDKCIIILFIIITIITVLYVV